MSNLPLEYESEFDVSGKIKCVSCGSNGSIFLVVKMKRVSDEEKLDGSIVVKFDVVSSRVKCHVCGEVREWTGGFNDID
jgi:ribosomal protein S27E